MARSHSLSLIDRIGRPLAGVTSVEAALKVAGLDFEADFAQLQYLDSSGNMHISPKHSEVYRTDTGAPLGVVGSKYKILQNQRTFEVVDDILDEMDFSRGGLIGSTAFITLKTKSFKLAGDEIESFVIIQNSFNGSSKASFSWAPMRKVCSNGLFVEIPGVGRTFSVPHTGDIDRKYQKLYIQNFINDRITSFKDFSTKLIKMQANKDLFIKCLDEFFPIKEEDVEKPSKNLQKRMELQVAYNQEDLQNFNGTAYKIFQAFCDFESHSPLVFSKKEAIAERQRFERSFYGYLITQRVLSWLQANA